MEFQNLKFEKVDSVGIITLNRPETNNALSKSLLDEMNSLLVSIAASREMKVIIIRAAGKNFCAGHDLRELTGENINVFNSVFSTCSEMMLRLQRIPQPVIAQVQGIATAAGCQLVAACDLAIAEEEARFGTPGVNLGVFCSTPAVSIVRSVGRKRALEMLFTARLISALEAEQWGLVNRVVPAKKIEAETMALACQIAKASLSCLAIGKKAFYTQVNLPDMAAYDHASSVIVNNFFTEDGREGVTAFLEKRKPVWKNR
ncbi:MAG TPA: enoyl-CoA hydratase [Smithellaceae bacterium]|jgi:enoyl-CoA hydratase/carnithine racemase|nr:MAG: putative enoyl-CoA hydratase echA8 [Deltaproteobacteria bacterium ADurb.BinA014]HNQ18306.1 enoyl-CoA hydratase [Smithellaceae bacterium]HNT90875.1 enoyl-CoA hydratase [Smithellaceae bacterium]HNV64700.1 enoyl-CoA hydratase [Smithellaceae bacterium]HNZ30912.1 enoyl-CoA hydratase [Smithellaceae bacterium]